jgi:rfaE bifunctional protein kinase chain/domain
MLTRERFHQIAAQYPRLRMAVVGDFCLDRYLEIDPSRAETSIETGLPVHNVVSVRAQPGGAGTVLNNLAALGIGEIHPLGFCGEDGEGYELLRALAPLPGVCVESMLQTPLRRTFTYCKPLLMDPGVPPRELNRLDSKNWTPTPEDVQRELIRRLNDRVSRIDALILLEQVDLPETGVITAQLLAAVNALQKSHPKLCVLADSRRGLGHFPPLGFKMNRAELARLTNRDVPRNIASIKQLASELAARQRNYVFVTLAEEGIVGAAPDGHAEHVLALPTRGPIDIVGAGDCVTANLTAALAAGATLLEALQIATAAASVVIHQLGTTGTATVEHIAALQSNTLLRG